MKRILITGANGQLGSEIASKADTINNIYFFTDVDELDICNREAVCDYITKNSIEVVINCAAYTAVDTAEDDKANAYKINSDAVENIAIACKEQGAVLLHVSTDYVFDGKGDTPYNESDSTQPIGVYGDSKLKGEEVAMASGCSALIFRTSWLYSEFGNNFVKTMIRLTAERDELMVVNDQRGCPTYAADLAELLVMLSESGKYEGCEGIYHFSNEGAITWFDFACEIARLAGNNCDIKPCTSAQFPSKVTRPSYSVMSKSKVQEVFGVVCREWQVALEECINKLK